MYVKDIQLGICCPSGTPTIEKQTVSTALVNGMNLLGPVVGNFSMNLAIQKAKETGIGWVSAYGNLFYNVNLSDLQGSNHYGIAGWYSMMASDLGLIVGLIFTHCIFIFFRECHSQIPLL